MRQTKNNKVIKQGLIIYCYKDSGKMLWEHIGGCVNFCLQEIVPNTKRSKESKNSVLFRVKPMLLLRLPSWVLTQSLHFRIFPLHISCTSVIDQLLLSLSSYIVWASGNYKIQYTFAKCPVGRLSCGCSQEEPDTSIPQTWLALRFGEHEWSKREICGC